MAINIIRITREQLRTFCPDDRTIRAFEQLFANLSSDPNSLVSETEYILIDAGSAIALGNRNNDTLTKTEIRQKSNGVLTWLSMQ